MYNYQWSLFSDDLRVARFYLLQSLHEDPINIQSLHNALGLGLSNEIERCLIENKINLSDIEREKLLFRIAKVHGDKYPYLKVVSEEVMQLSYKKFEEAIYENNFNLRIVLNGGIGDHLQSLGLIHWWNKNKNKQLTVEVERKRYLQLRSLISNYSSIKIITNIQKIDNSYFTCTPLDLELLIQYGEGKVKYTEWLKDISTNSKRQDKLICCWRSNGEQDRFSCFNRSVPFHIVLKFYKCLKDKNFHKEILDITEWTEWEHNIFKSIGIKFYDPRKKDVKNLMNIVQGGEVITIDTSLAHLCASMGKKATLLLPLFPDERWKELLQANNSYALNLNVIQQVDFNNWEKVIKILEKNCI